VVTSEHIKTLNKLQTLAMQLVKELSSFKSALEEPTPAPTPALEPTTAEQINRLSVELKDQIRAEVRAALNGAATPKAKRPTPRQWTLDEKRRILHEAATAKGKWGGVQRVQDKYGISSAHLVQWRDQLANAAKVSTRRGTKDASTSRRSEP
jgi:hypothetical protein